MAEATTARLFQNGRSQAVRLPREFRFPGDRVRIRRLGRGVLLEPLLVDTREWFAEIDQVGSGASFPERDQPLTPVRDIELG